jgi:hypothetical protein
MENFVKDESFPPKLTPSTRINIYNYNILSPAKCGSRFLDKLFNTIDCPDGKQIISNVNTDSTYQIKKAIPLETLHSTDCEIDVNKIEWIILRPPEDLMISSIHTEMLICWNKKYDEENIVTEDIISNQLNKYGYNNHYSKNLYRDLCFLWMKSKKRIKFVHLNNLSSFSKDILNPYYTTNLQEWDTKDYNFSNYDIWFSKDDIITYYKNSYPIQWEQLQSNLIKENIFWNSIVKGAEFYEPIVTKPIVKLI